MKVLVPTAAAFALLIAGCGNTKTVTVTEQAETPPAAAPEPDSDAPSIGATQDDDQGLALTVIKLERGVEGPSYGHLTLSDGPRSPQTHEFARIDLKVKNEGTGSVSLWGFSLVDKGGRRYGEEPNELFVPNALGEQLGPGDVLRGYTGFVIPKRAKIVGVHYAGPTGDTLNWGLHDRVGT